MAARDQHERGLVSGFDKLNLATKPPSGFVAHGKSSSPNVKPLQPRQLIPHPPVKKKPTPPTSPPKSTYFRKFYACKTDESYEQRISGDGEAFNDDEESSGSKYPSFERLPPDGCFSDIAEEDEDADDIDDNDMGFDAADDEEALHDFDDDFCDDDDDIEDDDDACSIAGSMFTASTNSRATSARTRATSARLNVNNIRTSSPAIRRLSAGSKAPPPLTARKANWVSEGEQNVEVKPALTPSLFAHLPPTIHFTIEGEKVAPLPPETRKLLKWKMSSITPNVVKQCIARSGFKPTKRNNDWLGYWGKHMKASLFKSVREYQKVNHFPGTFQIGRKDRLWRNLSRMQVHYGKKEFGFIPQTFILPYDFKLLKRAWDDGGSRQKWILKPPASARGIGIKVIHKWTQIPRKRPVVVQRYLHKPYLINGSKFDLRVYVYITSYDPLRIYVFEDGLVRFATCKYSSSVKTLSNRFMHLTNYSVNKKNEGAYQANSDDSVCQGHKWSLKSLWGYLRRKGVNTTQVWDSVKDVVVKTIIASESPVNTLVKQNVRKKSCCNELFGFDIFLDETLKPWILEVNISPSLHSNSQLDRNIKGQMIKDLMNLAGFHIPDNVTTTSTSSTSSMNLFVQDKGVPALASDEKAKHAFYVHHRLDERTKQTILDVLTPDDIRMLMETEDEHSRRGCFQRAFPSMISNKYLRFFDSNRYYNVLLDEWTRKYMREGRSTALGVALLCSYAEQKLHIGSTSDTNHQWSSQGMTYRSFSAPSIGLEYSALKPRSLSAPSLSSYTASECKCQHRMARLLSAPTVSLQTMLECKRHKRLASSKCLSPRQKSSSHTVKPKNTRHKPTRRHKKRKLKSVSTSAASQDKEESEQESYYQDIFQLNGIA